jgi:hypothetical protein
MAIRFIKQFMSRHPNGEHVCSTSIALLLLPAFMPGFLNVVLLMHNLYPSYTVVPVHPSGSLLLLLFVIVHPWVQDVPCVPAWHEVVVVEVVVAT